MRNEPRRFLVRASVFGAGICLIFALVAGIFLMVPKDPTSYALALSDKDALLAGIPGRRIVIVGGSNVAFGIDSRSIERATGMPAMNMGVNIGLGLEYMLDDVEPRLHAGDVVVVSPEYDHFFDGDILHGGIALAEYLLKYHPSGLTGLSSAQARRVLKNTPAVVRETIVSDGIRGIRTGDQAGNVYSRGSFDDHGDMVAHLKLADQAFPVDPKLEGPVDLDAIRALHGFALRSRSRGIDCFVTHPTLRRSDFEVSRAAIDRLDRLLRADGSLRILGDPETFVFADTVYFNAKYHLDARGRALRTGTLSRLLLESGVGSNREP